MLDHTTPYRGFKIAVSICRHYADMARLPTAGTAALLPCHKRKFLSEVQAMSHTRARCSHV